MIHCRGIRFPRCLVFLGALLLFTEAAGAEASESIQLIPQALMPGPRYRGYELVAFGVRNRDRKHRHVLEVWLSPMYRTEDRFVTRRLTIEPDTGAAMEMFLPAALESGSTYWFGAYVDGRRWKRRPMPIPGSGAGGGWWRSGMPPPCVLFSRSLDRDAFQKAWREIFGPKGKKRPRVVVRVGMGGGARSGPLAWVFVRAEREVSAWSENWLAFSKYTGIVLGAEDLRRMPAGVRRAILRWVECGGILVAAGEAPLPDAWREAIAGWPAFPGLGSDPQVGFGRIYRLPTADFRKLTKSPCRRLDYLVRQWGMQCAKPREHPNREFPVRSGIRSNYVPLFLGLLGFVIVVGPVNVFWAKRRKRQTALLWTMPLMSFLAFLAVGIYTLVYEGITPFVRMSGITLLDQRTHHAVTIGVIGYYSSLPPWGGLHFGTQTEITPWRKTYWKRPEIRRYRVDWTVDQHLASSWIRPRIPGYLFIRKAERRGERMEIHPDGKGGVTVLNGLGGDVHGFWYRDAAGKIYYTARIPAGAKVTLSAEDVPARGGPGAAFNGVIARLLFENPWGILDEKWRRIPHDFARRYLAENSYVALLNQDCPFLEDGLGKTPVHRRAQAVVVGFAACGGETP